MGPTGRRGGPGPAAAGADAGLGECLRLAWGLPDRVRLLSRVVLAQRYYRESNRLATCIGPVLAGSRGQLQRPARPAPSSS